MRASRESARSIARLKDGPVSLYKSEEPSIPKRRGARERAVGKIGMCDGVVLKREFTSILTLL
jgi:hypothetical protein